MRETEHRGTTRWHTRGLLGLAVLPAAALAAVVFAAPARADDQPLAPASALADHVSAGVTVIVAQPEADVLSAAGIEADPVATIAAVEENPAYEAALLPVEDDAIRPPRAAPTPQAAVISPAEPVTVVPRNETAGRPLQQPRPTVERQYHEPRVQYQGAPEKQPTTKPRTVVHRPSREAEHAPSEVPAEAQNSDPHCNKPTMEVGFICSVDPDWNFSWNCAWIAGCTPEVPPVPTFDTVAEADEDEGQEASDCDDADWVRRQYQSPGGQYQPALDQDDDVSSCPESAERAVVPVTGGPVGGSGPPVTSPGQPSGSTASAVGPAVMPTPQPSAPPSDVEGAQVQPKPPEELPPVRVTGRPETSEVVQPATGTRPAAVRRQAVPESTARPKRRSTSAPPARTVRDRYVGTIAAHEPTSASHSSSGDGLRLLIFSMALFGLGLLVLAATSPFARIDRRPLLVLGSRLRSRGLSSGSRSVKRSGGIRYRD